MIVHHVDIYKRYCYLPIDYKGCMKKRSKYCGYCTKDFPAERCVFHKNKKCSKVLWFDFCSKNNLRFKYEKNSKVFFLQDEIIMIGRICEIFSYPSKGSLYYIDVNRVAYERLGSEIFSDKEKMYNYVKKKLEDEYLTKLRNLETWRKTKGKNKRLNNNKSKALKK